MLKQTMLTLGLIVAATPMAPSAGLAHYTSGVEHLGERTASFLASPFVAAFDPAPQSYQPPVAAVPPQVPPGMCRWERQVLDAYGRPMLDQYGHPLREFTIAPCQRPPY